MQGIHNIILPPSPGGAAASEKVPFQCSPQLMPGLAAPGGAWGEDPSCEQ